MYKYNMAELIVGYNRVVFRYIKDLVDNIETSKKGITTLNVLHGFTTLSNVYTMTLIDNPDVNNAIENANSASIMYIDFVVQMDRIDSSEPTGIRIGSRDAALFVYKKTFPAPSTKVSTQEETISESCSATTTEDGVRYSSNLSMLHLHKCFVRNMVTTLFSAPMFYDVTADTLNYYTCVIAKLLEVIATIESITLTGRHYTRLNELQYNNGIFDCNTQEDVNCYIDWIKYNIVAITTTVGGGIESTAETETVASVP